MNQQISSDLDPHGVDRSLPARCVLATREGQFRGADLRIYDFHSHNARLAPLRDIALIAWQTRAEVALHCGTIKTQAQMSPWDFSILRPGHESTWRWNTSFRTMVLFLNTHRLASIASDVFDQQVDEIEVRESLQLQDPVIHHIVATLATELRAGKLGIEYYSEALLTQLCIHILREHAEIRLRTPRCPGALSAMQGRHVADFIEGNLASDLSVGVLSKVAGISRYHFSRLFRKRFGLPPHAYVQQRRAERARQLLAHGDMALKEIVFATGFYDQSHLTKSFKRLYSMTPGELRRAGSDH